VNTEIGRFFGSKGEDLSLGQWKMLSVARALYRRSSVLLFDEPTSYLDPKKEELLTDLLLKSDGNRICLINCHNSSIAARTDKVIVLDKGEIVEVGDPGTLLRQTGPFQHIYEMQGRGYAGTLAEDSMNVEEGATLVG
jgi:ABC-type multidrug transport system fused ATPase/permease subunit